VLPMQVPGSPGRPSTASQPQQQQQQHSSTAWNATGQHHPAPCHSPAAPTWCLVPSVLILAAYWLLNWQVQRQRQALAAATAATCHVRAQHHAQPVSLTNILAAGLPAALRTSTAAGALLGCPLCNIDSGVLGALPTAASLYPTCHQSMSLHSVVT
jgi:hypothetical protein